MLLWRSEQLRQIADAVALAKSGTPAVIVVSGEAGSGKTSLLEEVAARAAGMVVLSGEGRETGDWSPYDLLAELGVDVTPTVEGRVLSPVLAAQRLRAVLDEFSGGTPMLLRIDDLQWVDPESVETLTSVLSRVVGDRLLVAVGTRPLALNQHRGWQRWSAAGAQLALDGLSREDATALARTSWPDLDASVAQRLWEHTSGNPMYLKALLAEYEPAELTRMPVLPAPAQFAQLLGARLARLPEGALPVLRAVSTLGSGWLSLLDVGALAAIDDLDVAVQTLVENELVQLRYVEFGVSIRVSHSLVRAATYQQTPLPQRRALHARAAAIVSPPSSVLEHRMAAADQYDSELAADVEAYAAQLHEQRSHRLAARYLRSASALTAAPGERERRWIDSLYESVLAYDLAAVHAESPDLDNVSDPTRQALVLGTLATFEFRCHDAVAILSRELRSGRAIDPATQYRLEVPLAAAAIAAGSPTADVVKSIARAQPLEPKDFALAEWALFTRGHVASRSPEQHLAGLEDLPENPAAVSLADTGRLAWRGSHRANSAIVAPAIADLTEVTKRVGDGLLDFGGGGFHAYLARMYWFSGDWALARLNFRLAQDLSPGDAHTLVAVLAPIPAIGDGDLARADELIAQAETALLAVPWIEARDLLTITHVIRLHAAGSEAERAAFFPSVADSVREVAEGRIGKNPLWSAHVALAAIWANRLGAAEVARQNLTRPDVAWIPAVNDWLLGLIAEARGQPKIALGHLRAASGNAANDLRLYRGHMLVDHARIAGQLGDRAGAAAALAGAQQIYGDIGATSYAQRSESGPPTEPVVALTDRERDVLTLAATGMSYAQIARDLFITQSTVSYHLSNVYSKVGVSSRHELTEAVRRDPRSFGLVSAVA